NPGLSTNASAIATEGLWYETLLTNGQTLLREGTNVVAIRLFNQDINSTDLGVDIELIRPEGGTVRLPTPGEENSVYSEVAPPQVREVEHAPREPRSGEDIVITAKISDPQGVGSVKLLYQAVHPGSYIP